jgi:hypothetical protein
MTFPQPIGLTILVWQGILSQTAVTVSVAVADEK